MKPFTTTFTWAGTCTPDEVIPGCTIAETEEGDLEITVQDSRGLFNLIKNITDKVSNEIKGYQDIHITPEEDACSDIKNTLGFLYELSEHIWE